MRLQKTECWPRAASVSSACIVAQLFVRLPVDWAGRPRAVPAGRARTSIATRDAEDQRVKGHAQVGRSGRACGDDELTKEYSRACCVQCSTTSAAHRTHSDLDRPRASKDAAVPGAPRRASGLCAAHLCTGPRAKPRQVGVTSGNGTRQARRPLTPQARPQARAAPRSTSLSAAVCVCCAAENPPCPFAAPARAARQPWQRPRRTTRRAMCS